MRTENLGICRFPDYGVSTHGGRCRQVATDGSEIKGGYGQYKSFQTTDIPFGYAYPAS